MKLPVLCHEEVVEEIKDIHDIFQDDGSGAGDDLGLLVLHHRFDVVQRTEHLLHLSLKLVHILKTESLIKQWQDQAKKKKTPEKRKILILFKKSENITFKFRLYS